MSIRSRFANRHKRQDWPIVKSLILKPGDPMIYDTDKTPPEGNPSTPPNQPVPLVTTQMGFQHPAGFEPAAVLIIGMNKEGKTFINMPIEQPHLCLHLATITLQCASEMAVKTMHDALMKKSPIVPVPPGLTIPPWAEPA